MDIEEVECGADDGEGEGGAAEDGGASVCAPGGFAVDEETPDEEGECEEEGEGGVADVADGRGDGVDGVAPDHGEELHDGCDDCEGSEEGKDETTLETGWIEKSEELDMCYLE